MITALNTMERAQLTDMLTMLRDAAGFGYGVEDAAVNLRGLYGHVSEQVWEHAIAIVTAETAGWLR